MILNNRRYRPTKASARLEELGSPRSVHTLRKDHGFASGERGPRWVRDERGDHWYFEADLIAWAQDELRKLSAGNPPRTRPQHFDTAASDS